jgi:predicted MFS family arabinose efflux permease
LVVGYAIGSSVGGALVDSSSPAGAFAVSALAMTVGTTIAVAMRSRAGRRIAA